MKLEPLAIVEAVGKEIKLTNVPSEGATALIPLPPNPGVSTISVYIADQEVVPRKPVGAPVDGFYKVLVPRSALLVHAGLNKAFHYVLLDDDANPAYSDPFDYNIWHS